MSFNPRFNKTSSSMSDSTTTTASPDWARIYPDADHRWVMGLRPGNAAEFFAARDVIGAVCAERAEYLAADPDKYVALTPEAEPALLETVELARTFGVSIDETLPAAEQLLALGRAWESDFVWMHAAADATHRLIGGIVCFPSFWDIREKLGRPMSEIHEPVPGLNAALGSKIETFLSSLVPGVSWLREIAGYSRDIRLNHHPSRPFRRLDATVTTDEIWIRLEHQLLLKLPRSGSILFGIRVELSPLASLLADEQAAARLLRAISTMSPAAAAYKGLTASRERIIELIQNS
jgi:hypothetical protein